MPDEPLTGQQGSNGPTVRGSIDLFLSHRVHGWAFRPGCQDPLRLALEVNGETRATLPCDQERKDFSSDADTPKNCGFSIDPRPYLSVGRNTCRLIVDGDAKRQFGAPADIVIPDRGSSAPIVASPAQLWAGRTDPSFLLRSATAPTPARLKFFGLFNSGTNFALKLAEANRIKFADIDTHKLLFKHYPPPVLEQIGSTMSAARRERILLVVLARSPYDWIRSMMVARYGCRFKNVTSEFRINLGTLNYGEVSYEDHIESYLKDADWRQHFAAPSIAEFWSNYYRGWMKIAENIFPNVMFIRYEDLVAHPCELVFLIQSALLQPSSGSVTVPVVSAKTGHTHSRDYWGAKRKLLQVNTDPPLSAGDLREISMRVDPAVCDYFGYPLL